MKLLRWLALLFAIDCVISTALLAFAPEQTHNTINCIVEALP